MSLSTISIRRPVLTTVFSVVIVIFGIIGFLSLGVREYPAIDTPTITIITTYPGAGADVVESQITEPIEEAVSAVAGIDSVSSTSREGSSQIRIEFTLETDLEAAANDVRDQLGRASRYLPPDANPPIVYKSDADSSPIYGVVVRSGSRDLMELSYIAERVKERLQTVPGVSFIDLVGEKRYSMKLYLDPQKLAAYNLTPLDVRNAIRRENVELPAGRIEGESVELAVRTLSRLSTEDEFRSIVLKREADRIVRVSDVAEVKLAPLNERSLLRVGSEAMIGVYIRSQPGSNQIAIADALEEKVAQLQLDFPEDITIETAYDNTEYVRASISEVKETILLAFGLVIVVILAFFRNWRTTIIPVVVIPISIIGTFFVLYMLGFSINILTLLGVVLAIGLVVDDAIVVLENIYAKIEQGANPIDAGINGTKEIFFAIISTTAALASVFMPILFMSGMTGKLFREFALTVSASVVISAFVALTLTPMLCTRLLKAGNHGRFYNATEPFFVFINEVYGKSLGFVMKHRWTAFVMLIASAGVIHYAFKSLPRELTPLEDRGRIWARITGPEGASFEYMDKFVTEMTALVAEIVPEARLMMTQVPTGGPGGIGAINNGFVRVFLPEKSARERTQMDIAAALQKEVNKLPGARTNVVQEPSVGERRGAGLAAQIVILGSTLGDLEDVVPLYMEEIRKSPVFSFVDIDLKFNNPEAHIEIDRARARALGVSPLDIAETVQIAMGGQRIGYFLKFGKQYEVQAQMELESRRKTGDLTGLKVRTSSGDVIPLENLVTVRETSGPPQRFRYNRYAAATISGTLNPGYTLGEGIVALNEAASASLPPQFATDVVGSSRDFLKSSSSLGFGFVLALVLIYLVLAAQFESFRDPFTIMLSVPLSMAGALGSLLLLDQSLNIFSQIGLIMLIGLITKNGILIVEFANQRKEAGLPLFDAIYGAAKARFRPILMTSISTILGALPIALALGAGSESRMSLGIALIGGLVVGTTLTLYVVPVMLTFLSPKTPALVTETRITEAAALPLSPIAQVNMEKTS